MKIRSFSSRCCCIVEVRKCLIKFLEYNNTLICNVSFTQVDYKALSEYLSSKLKELGMSQHFEYSDDFLSFRHQYIHNQSFFKTNGTFNHFYSEME